MEVGASGMQHGSSGSVRRTIISGQRQCAGGSVVFCRLVAALTVLRLPPFAPPPPPFPFRLPLRTPLGADRMHAPSLSSVPRSRFLFPPTIPIPRTCMLAISQRVDIEAKDSSALVGLARGGQKLEDSRHSFKKALDSLIVLASLQVCVGLRAGGSG